MRVGVVGASGFIGKNFCERALGAGHTVVGYSRHRRSSESESIQWRIFDEAPDMSELDAVVNFAGDSIAQRWSEEKKKKFYESRVGVTELLHQQIAKLPIDSRPKVLVNSSAVGYYGDCGDTSLDESSSMGGGYLATLCEQWERAAYKLEDLGLRVVVGRIGIILGPDGEAWGKMKTAFKLGAGGPLGDGSHWMPWMHVDDVAGGVLLALENSEINGVMNLVSPDPRKNSDFTKALGKALKRPTFIPAPVFALRIVFGEFGKHLVDSYRVYPKVLEKYGYQFSYPSLEGCFLDLV